MVFYWRSNYIYIIRDHLYLYHEKLQNISKRILKYRLIFFFLKKSKQFTLTQMMRNIKILKKYYLYAMSANIIFSW